MNVDAVTHAIDNQTKAVFCVTPNNPSGAILPQDNLDNFISGIPENVLFVVDRSLFRVWLACLGTFIPMYGV
jgi:histidinol-phosphate aminotransferase